MFRHKTAALATLVAMAAALASPALAASSVEMGGLSADDVSGLRCADARVGSEVNYALKAVVDATGATFLALTQSHRFATVMPRTTFYGIEAVEDAPGGAATIRATALDGSGDALALAMGSLGGGASTLTLAPFSHHRPLEDVPMACANPAVVVFP